MVRLIVSLAALNHPHRHHPSLTWAATRAMDIFLSIYTVRSEDVKSVAAAALFFASAFLKLPPLDRAIHLDLSNCSEAEFICLLKNFFYIVTPNRFGKCPLDRCFHFFLKMGLTKEHYALAQFVMEIILLFPTIVLQRSNLVAAAICGIIFKQDSMKNSIEMAVFCAYFKVNTPELFHTFLKVVKASSEWRKEVKPATTNCPIFVKFADQKYDQVSLKKLSILHPFAGIESLL